MAKRVGFALEGIFGGGWEMERRGAGLAWVGVEGSNDTGGR
jgi:hypothetical protein